MATSVKVDDDTKSRLEELQAEVKLETGRKVTQQAILERLVDHAFESREEFVESFRDSAPEFPLSAERRERWLSGTTASGVETDEEDVDEVLYGDPDDV